MIKRSSRVVIGFAALSASLPTVASASTSVTFTVGSDFERQYYEAPYYGYNIYLDYGRDDYYDDKYDDDIDGNDDYTTARYIDAPDYATETEIYSRQEFYGSQPCASGTTGAIVGAVVGGLLGGEVGRDGYYNERSTTGAIIGAGGGALVGRAIERSGCK